MQVERVMSHRRPHFELDLAEAGRFVEDKIPVKEGIRCTVRLPLMVKGQVIGVLFLDDVEPGRYSEHDLELLVPLGEQLVIAIENSRLHGEMERKVEERTRTLRETQTQLIQSGKLAAVGTLAARVAHEAADGPGRSVTDRLGAPELGYQRSGRHGADRDGSDYHPDRSHIRQSGGVERDRYRPRHPRRDPDPDLRSLFYDERGRQGNGARPEHLSWDCRGARGRVDDGESGGQWKRRAIYDDLAPGWPG